MDFVGRPEAMALAQPAVDRIVHLPDSVVTGRVEVDARGEVYFDAPIHCQAFGCVVLGWLSSVSTGWPVARVREGRVRRVRSR